MCMRGDEQLIHAHFALSSTMRCSSRSEVWKVTPKEAKHHRRSRHSTEPQYRVDRDSDPTLFHRHALTDVGLPTVNTSSTDW